MDNTFLAISKEYFGLNLKSVDLLIIAQIEEFERNTGMCYVTNEQFSELFGESVSTIKRSLDKLDGLGIITRNTICVKGLGRANKQRTLSVNNRKEWKVQNEPTITMQGSKNEMESSNVDNGRFKSSKWKVQNEPIKEKEKDNIKDNINLKNKSDIYTEPINKKDYINKSKKSFDDFNESEYHKIYRCYQDNDYDIKKVAFKYDTTEDVAKRIIDDYESCFPFS